MNRMLKSVYLLTLLLSGSVSVFAAVYSEDAQSLQTVKVFVNDSGSAMTSGTAVVLNIASTNAVTGTSRNAPSSMGLVITTTTVADVKKFVGIVKDDTCIDQGECRVITWGPALARFACSTDNTNTVEGQVGTTTVAGQLGTGSNAGTLMTPAVNTITTVDNCQRWVFVNPNNSN